MTHEWKAGDLAVVKIAEIADDFVRIEMFPGESDPVPYEGLRPLPPILTPEAQAVLDAAVEVDVADGLDDEANFVFDNAVTTYRAILSPPDPVAELRRIFESRFCSGDWGQKMDAAIAAIEKERG